MAHLPPFTPGGVLPPGDYVLTLAQLRESRLVLGPDKPGRGNWDSAWRGRLVDNLEILVRQLWTVGIANVYADGSFVEDKDHPNDIDGYFVCNLEMLMSGELQRRLQLLEPDKVWTWDPASRRRYRGYPKAQLPMWHKYRVELYPHVPDLAAPTGIRDAQGHELEFPSAFRRTRWDGSPRGIIKIVPGVSP